MMVSSRIKNPDLAAQIDEGQLEWQRYIAVMLLGITWMFDGIPDDISPGLQLYPAHLERKIAEFSVSIHSTS